MRNVARIHSIVGEGSFKDPNGRTITQTAVYYEAVDTDASLLQKFKNSKEKPSEQVEQIVQQICQVLDGPQDELFLYGFGQGANIARAVAAVIHHMGIPKKNTSYKFGELYQHGLDLIRAKREDDGIKGSKILRIFEQHCEGAPQIQFAGLFDAVKGAADKTVYDISLLNSVRNLRHALALNETRTSLTPDLVAFPKSTDLAGTSLIAAWFLGTHDDIGGGVNHDGLSLYPLQWMVLESIKAGLILKPSKDIAGENPLSLVFPQFAGEAPRLEADEHIEWRLQFVNGLEISMFDLHASHSKTKGADDSTHSVRLQEDTSFYTSPRKVFDYNGVSGWSEIGTYTDLVFSRWPADMSRFP